MTKVLIHTVSGERMQNLLPILAWRPDRVIQICSNHPKILAAAEHTAQAARVAGITADFQTHTLPNVYPSCEDVRYAHKQLLSVFPRTLVNITGGTKLMSIGAYLAASEFDHTPILYCDSINHRFVQVGDTALPPELQAFPVAASQITVPVVMAAQGKEFRADAITPRLLEFGRAAWRLRCNHHEPIAAWTSQIRNAIPRKAGRILDKKSDLQQFLQSPLPTPVSDAAELYLDEAVEAQLLRVDPSGRIFMQAEPKKSSIEFISNLLDGAWLELAVASMAREGTRYKDIHWSVQPHDQSDADYGETDLIAVDQQKLTLAVISCKTSTEHISTLEHISSWRDRARTLGGSHASGHLCVFRAKSPHQITNLQAMGQAMNVRIHIGEDIPHHFSAS